jgi:hypothetical protein
LTPTRGRHLPQLCDQARRNAEGVLRDHGKHSAADALPVGCPCRFADLLPHDWYAENQHGLIL